MTDVLKENYKGNEPFCFISYAHADKEAIKPLLIEIQKSFRRWIDDDIEKGSLWEQEIKERIEECSVFIFMCSKESCKSKYCKKEIKFFLKIERENRKNAIFIPVFLDDTEAPDFISQYQGVKYDDYDCEESVVDDLFKNKVFRSTMLETPEKTFLLENKHLKKFDGKINSKNIEIPFGVEYVDNDAFENCRFIRNLIIPKTVKKIEKHAFLRCNMLRHIIVEDENPVYDSRNNCDAIIETATNKLILGCKNTKIPETIKSIENEAFSHNEKLEKIKIPKSVDDIKDDSFKGCDNIIEIKVEEGNPKYDSRNDSNAIIETATNKIILGCNKSVIPDTIITIGKNSFDYCSTLSRIDIPDSVQTIEDGAFKGCNTLRKAKLCDNISFIGNHVFEGCDQLSYADYGNASYLGSKTNSFLALVKAHPTINSCEIHETCSVIANDAFRDCYNLLEISVDCDNEKYDSRNDCNAIIETASNKLLVGCVNTIIPDDIIEIAPYAFNNCDTLKSIIFPDSVIKIGERAFQSCDEIEAIELPKNLTTLEPYVFGTCSKLKHVIIPQTLVSIDKLSFYNSPIESITYKGTQSQWEKIKNHEIFDSINITFEA